MIYHLHRSPVKAISCWISWDAKATQGDNELSACFHAMVSYNPKSFKGGYRGDKIGGHVYMVVVQMLIAIMITETMIVMVIVITRMIVK